MIDQIKRINGIIRKLKENKIAEIESIDRFSNNILFYDFMTQKHIDVKRLLVLYEKMEKDKHKVSDNIKSEINGNWKE